MSKNKKKVFLYGRVSTDTQQTGLESQIRALKRFCEQSNISDYELFTDENISGAKSSRPALNRMMDAVDKGEASQVVVFSFSRFARSTTHLLTALQKFKERDVQFTSLTEKIDTNSAMGVAVFTILGAISQLERELIAERVRAGLANARAKGKQIGRRKERNSELIRALLKKKLTYRVISSISGASHGSIYAEKKLMQKEEQEVRKEQKKISEQGKQESIFSDSLPPLPIQ